MRPSANQAEMKRIVRPTSNEFSSIASDTSAVQWMELPQMTIWPGHDSTQVFLGLPTYAEIASIHMSRMDCTIKLSTCDSHFSTIPFIGYQIGQSVCLSRSVMHVIFKYVPSLLQE